LPGMERRDFIKKGGRLCLGLGGLWLAGGLASCADGEKNLGGNGGNGNVASEPGEPPPHPAVEPYPCDLAVAHGNDPAAQLRAALDAVGGIGRFGLEGKSVLIKPNAAFANPPDRATTTHPELLGEMVRLCLEAGAASVVVLDHLLTDLPDPTLEANGIGPAARAAGAQVRAYGTSRPGAARLVEIPGATALPRASVLREVLEADFIIDMPKAKHHSAAGLTLSMKNLIGTLADMGAMHRVDLHRAIAELNTVIRPGLIVLDATSILLNRGPGGPGDIDHPGEVVVGRDPVAVDSYAAALFGKKAADVPSIAHAASLGVGTTDFASLGLRRLEL